jgi:DNA replicative helicase MCM subunit Mcm2 (Cdc46/Mcm family)
MVQLLLEARKMLLEVYVVMQHGDVIPRTEVAYCIAIQQLEVLIRLLKAIMCFHCKFEVCFQLQM